MRAVGLPRARGRAVAWTLAVLLAGGTAACTTVAQRGPGAGVVAQLSVERFLQAANDRDIEAMGRLFGTEDGPILDTGGTFGCFFKKIGSWFGGTACTKRRDVEVRLDAIARLLQHQDYKIVREEAVAGRLTRPRASSWTSRSTARCGGTSRSWSCAPVTASGSWRRSISSA